MNAEHEAGSATTGRSDFAIETQKASGQPLASVPPQGLEVSRNTLGNSNNSQTVPPPVPPSSIDSIPSDAIELLSIWSKLDEQARRDLLKTARSLKGT